MEQKCGCVYRKILKAERKDYLKGTEFVVDKMCEKHNKEYNEYKKKGKIKQAKGRNGKKA